MPIGNEWYFAVVDNEMFSPMVIAAKHGGEMLNSTPLRPTVVEPLATPAFQQ